MTENIKLDFFNNTINSININILDHGLFKGDSSWRHKDVKSPFNRLYLVLDGEGYLQSGSIKTMLMPGMMYLIPVNSTNTYVCDSFIRKFYLHFRAEIYYGRDIFEALSSTVSLAYDVNWLLRLIEEVREEKLSSIYKFKGFLFDVIDRFASSVPAVNEQQMDVVYKYCDLFRYVKDNCSAKLNLKELSGILGYRYDSLSKKFRRDMGYSLKSYLNKSLVQAAKEKLLLSEMNIKEIAYNLGFTDEFYFSRFFKKHTGISPKEYRKKNMIKT